MGRHTFEEALEQSLTLVQSGSSVDECLRTFPEFADELGLQLSAAVSLLGANRELKASVSAQARGRVRLLDAVNNKRMAAENATEIGLLMSMSPLRWLIERTPRLGRAHGALTAGIVIFILGAAAVGASAATGQGPVGSFLASNSGPSKSEIQGIVSAVDCDGGHIAIAGVDIQLQPGTEFDDLACADILVGDAIKVTARNQNGMLVALHVEREGEVSVCGSDAVDGSCDGDGGDVGNVHDSATDQQDTDGDVDHQSDVGSSGGDDRDADQPGTDGSDDDGHDADQPGTDGSADDDHDADQPSTDSSAADGHDADQFGTDSSDDDSQGDTGGPSDDEVSPDNSGGGNHDDEAGTQDVPREADSTGCEVRGLISSLDPLVIGGMTIDDSNVEEVTGDLAQAMTDGLTLKVEGTTDGNVCVAREIKVEE